LKQLLDVDTCLCAGLDEHHTEILGKGLTLLGVHLALIGEIDLVCHEYYQQVIPSDGLGIIYPLGHVGEGSLVSDVINHHCY